MGMIQLVCPACMHSITCHRMEVTDYVYCTNCNAKIRLGKKLDMLYNSQKERNTNYDNNSSTDNPADSLYKLAKTFEKLNEKQRAIEKYEIMVDQYPEDYRGWFGLMYLMNIDCDADAFNNVVSWYNHAYYLANSEYKPIILAKFNEWNKQRYDFLCQRGRGVHLRNISFGNNLARYLELSEQEAFYKDGVRNAELCNKKKGVLDLFGIKKEDRFSEASYGYGENDNIQIGFSRFVFVNGCIIVIERSCYFKKHEWKSFGEFTNKFTINGNMEKILKDLPDTSEKTEGCYIATCVYGSYDCPKVWTLRRFRDDVLSKRLIGKLFIKSYYKISPILVRLFGNMLWFKVLWKNILDVLVRCLNKMGILDTKYTDKNNEK